MSRCSNTICWKDVPFYCLYSFVKNQLIIFRWVDFWALYPVSLMYLSVLLPTPHCLDHCSFLCSKSYNQVCRFFDFVLSALFFPLFPWLLDTDAAVNSGFFLLLSSPVLMDHLLHHTSSFFPPRALSPGTFPSSSHWQSNLGCFQNEEQDLRVIN